MDYAASVSPNPSSIHSLGIEAKKKLENSRREVARVLGARPSNIIFTGGGTESNNLAIQGVVLAWHEQNKVKKLPHIITTDIEHPSVLETFKLLEKRK
ncbi:MAG TPA: aminotransferase class V-fold PLP-dependent enzyme, partial [Candidatus Paceibacterota bacterium]|nr:aminotransferase class V-fold PLP-dependent enzyme [Candidatus Paceibacterota bacterium]